MDTKIKLTIILLLMVQIPFAYCDPYDGWGDRNIYPAHTPRTYIPRQTDYNTQFTIDITPKYWMVKDEPIDWQIRLQVDVLEDDKVSRIMIAVYVPYITDPDFDSGDVFILDYEGNPVSEMVKTDSESSEGLYGGWWYSGVVEKDGYFMKGEYFYIEFTEHNAPHDLLVTYYVASGNMELEAVNRIYVWVEYGSEYDAIPPKMFAVPEYPLGTLGLLIMMVGALTYARTKYSLDYTSEKCCETLS